MKSREQRAAVLARLGATAGEVEELLTYTDQRFQAPAVWPTFPLADEPFVAVWEDYLEDAKRLGVFPALQSRLVQLRFPIQAGISQTEDYRAATRCGVPPDASSSATGLTLRRPEALHLEIVPTPAGWIPVVQIPEREDFVALLQALSQRNEPTDIPASQGASIVSGLNNWDRVARYRRHWQEADPAAHDDHAWPAEFQRLAARKELYQDRLLLLSTGPYSNTPGQALGLSEDAWLRASLVLRQAHEGVHYFTLRVFGSMRNNLLDEILADYAGIVALLGHYRAEWFLRFMGLEAFPHYRSGGRLENYRGQPPLSTGALAVLQALVVAATRNLEKLDKRLRGTGGMVDMGKLLCQLCGCTLEDFVDEQLANQGEALAGIG